MRQDPRLKYRLVQVGNGFTRGGDKLYKTAPLAEAARRRSGDYSLKVEEVPAPGWMWADCNGEAHSNPHIDHCSVCMPLWGRMLVKDPAVAERLGEIENALSPENLYWDGERNRGDALRAKRLLLAEKKKLGG